MAQQSSRQYFYLVIINYDESTYPQKIFLQEHEAVTWGRREATKAQKRGDYMYEFVLCKQEIARTATLKPVRTLEPYKDSTVANLKQPLEPFNWEGFEQQGSNNDIDKHYC